MQKYTQNFLKENMMGPNVIRILDEMLPEMNLNSEMNILDLGCGKGLTSIHLANETKAKVCAFDLWISATENLERFLKANVAEYIFPLNGDILSHPFADGYFDAVVCIDAYNYFGRDKDVLDKHIAPLVKKGGVIALGIPGMKQDFNGKYPDELLLSWSPEDLEYIKSITWWKKLWEEHSSLTDIVLLKELKCFNESWKDWLECDNPYAKNDNKSFAAGGGKYMNLIFAILQRK